MTDRPPEYDSPGPSDTDLDATWGRPRALPASATVSVGPPTKQPPRRQRRRTRPAREPLGDGEYPRTSMAVPALVLSITGVLCCGLGIFGAILGALDIRAIDRGLSDPSKRRAARAAVTLGLIETALLIVIILIWSPLVLDGMNQ